MPRRCRRHGLAAYGLGPGIGGHVSVRVPGKRQFHINAFDRSFEEMRQQDIALLDFDGHVHCTFDDDAGHDELFYHRRPGMAAITAARNVRQMLIRIHPCVS